jgi:ubiquinone/menaquinone biosynthesis C-methylase UbiE
MSDATSRHLAMNPDGLFATVMEWTNRPAYARAAHMIAPAEGQAILEIGFGTGRLLEILAATPGVRLAGVDPTRAMVRRARSRPALAKLGSRLDLREGADNPLPWAPDTFDAVVAVHSFQFWPNPNESLGEIHRVLKAHGKLLLVLRDHSRHAPDWLPNPISHSGAEVEGALTALKLNGFQGALAGLVGSSRCLAATKFDQNPSR